jgi:2-oxoisovalerate dehydrogenase E1 component
MDPDRAAAIDQAFVAAVRAQRGALARDLDVPLAPGTELTGRAALAIFDAQMTSRHLDLAARLLRARDLGYYTIGSSGHEGNAALAEVLRVTDPAFLHYRSGAFFLHRAARAGYAHAARDVLLGVCASSEEPIAGGRHKVFGSAALAIPPQTSTIASHLPKAVGMAIALDRRKRLDLPLPKTQATPPDAVVVCSLGDASLNHSTALGAVNAACSAAYQHLPVPILFVCEDNGLGISVPTPAGFIAATYRDRPGLAYFAADGCDLRSAFDAAVLAAAHVRTKRAPALLHLRTVRLMGHGGADLEIAYRCAEAILADEAADPLVGTARLLVAAGVACPRAILSRYEAIRADVRALAEEAAAGPKLTSAAQVMAPLAPRSDARLAAVASRPPDQAARRRFWGDRLPEDEPPLPLAGHIGATLGDLLVERPELVVFGEDVGVKGGVYGVTRGLHRRAGAARVFDTLLDEQAILGLAIGAGQLGLLPVPEIQYLAYLHNALDQIRGEASTLQFFSQGRYRNPMVVRIAGYAYQKGFGGHFHNDDSVAALRDIPGLVIASPSRGDDAAAMLRTCVAAARSEGSVCLFLEPIALYRTADLHAPGDGLYAFPYRADPEHVPLGRARAHGEGGDLLIVTFSNGLWMSLRALRRLEAEGIRCRVLDLRWLAPLPVEDLAREATRAGRVLVVDETRRTGGVSEAIFTALIEAGFSGAMRRVASLDSFVPLGPAAGLVLVQEAQIEAAAREMVGDRLDHRSGG